MLSKLIMYEVHKKWKSCFLEFRHKLNIVIVSIQIAVKIFKIKFISKHHKDVINKNFNNFS